MFHLAKTLSFGTPILSIVIYCKNRKNLFSTHVQAAENEMSLQQVQVIFRHGARTPLVNLNYSYDIPNIEESIWDAESLMQKNFEVDVRYKLMLDNGMEPSKSEAENVYLNRGTLRGGCYTGQLTAIGKEGMYNVGKLLAKEYIHKHGLISPVYSPTEVYVRSSNIKRTILSATSLLAGLYGKENIQEPVQMFTKPSTEEDMYPNWGHCNNLKIWANYVMRNHDRLPGHREDQEKIHKLIGGEDDKPLHFIALLDYIYCRKAHRIPVPLDLLAEEKLIVKRASELQAHVIGGENNSMLAYGIGSLINTFCCRITEWINEPRESKLLLYSAHDTTLIAILNVLDVFNKQWPPFGSYLALELYKRKDSKFFIRVVYNGEALIVDKEHGNEFIAVDKFLNLVGKYRVEDWALTCGNKAP